MSAAQRMARVAAAQMTSRLLQDVLQTASADCWDRRAAQFDAVGTSSADAKALACRRHAWLLRQYGDPEVVEALADVLDEQTSLAVIQRRAA